MRRALSVLLVLGLFTLSFMVATPTSAAADDSGTLARVATVSVDGSDTLLPPGELPAQWWGPWPLGFWGAGWPSWGAWGGWPWWAGMPLWQISAQTGYTWPWWPGSWGFGGPGGGGWGSPGGWGA